MLTLIDSDLVCYRCAASAENEPEDIAILRVDKLMREILEKTGAEEYKSFLTGTENFRYIVNPEYKANRKDKPRPVHLNACKEFLITEWNTKVTIGHEADDELGFNQTNETIIASIDKDLLQIPGLHFDWVKNELKEVSEIEGIKHFYRQLLIGDRTDNIFGIDGIGPVKAGKLIDHFIYEIDMYKTVKGLYDNDKRFLVNCDCLWIMRREDERFSNRESARKFKDSGW
jgi:5'-3' exonuclease